MNSTEWMEYITDIKNQITESLTEQYDNTVVDSSIDYENKIIKIEVSHPYDDEYLEEVEESVYCHLPYYNHEIDYELDGCNITITIGRELDEWEQEMNIAYQKLSEEQYYCNEENHKLALIRAVESLYDLYSKQSFAVELQNSDCLQSFYLRKKMDILEEIKKYATEFEQLIEEETEQSIK